MTDRELMQMAQGEQRFYTEEQMKDLAQKLADSALLNSAPPQREWQGLTYDEITEAMVFNKRIMAAHIEATLKEKNVYRN